MSRKRDPEAPQPAAGAGEEAESERLAADLVHALASGPHPK